MSRQFGSLVAEPPMYHSEDLMIVGDYVGKLIDSRHGCAIEIVNFLTCSSLH